MIVADQAVWSSYFFVWSLSQSIAINILRYSAKLKLNVMEALELPYISIKYAYENNLAYNWNNHFFKCYECDVLLCNV